MRVIQLNCVYPWGSTGKITQAIHRALLAAGEESLVLYGRGPAAEDPLSRKVGSDTVARMNNLLSRVHGCMYGGCFTTTRQILSLLEKERPDVVHLQCINGYFVNIYRLVRWLKEREIPTVLTLHAEFMYTANCAYALDCENWRTGCGHCPRLRQETKSWFLDGTARSFTRMREAFRGFEKDLTVVSVSPWLEARAAASPILGTMDHRVILNGVDTGVFCRRETSHLRALHGLENQKVIFHVTSAFSDSPDHIKGGYYLLALARRLADLPVRFLVAGNHSLTGDLPENVTLLGNIGDQTRLAEYYALGDLTLLTSKKETFSMPCAESLCCGTPIVGFRAGAPEGIALPDFSAFADHGDLDALEALVRRWLAREDLDRAAIASAAQAHYSDRRMTEQYLSLYRSLLYETST